jgi:two-component system, cell cycle sensor histidine kinase and response regulator CckA
MGLREQRLPVHQNPSRAKRPTIAGRRRPAPDSTSIGAAHRALVEESEEGMILADEDGRILFANGAAAKLLGRSPADLVGSIGFDLVRPEHLQVAREEFGRSLANPGLVVALQVDVLQPDDTARTLAVKLVNRLPVPGITAVVVNFHEAATAARSSANDRYRDLFYHAPIGLGIADLEGRLLAFNDAILRPGGYTREDIERLGNVALLYANQADRDRVLGLARSQGFVWREEVQFRRKDGTSYDALISLSPVEFGGRPCWYSAVEDITDHKRSEQERRVLEGRLRQAQKMEAVGNMTAGIAHDFNNLLTVIGVNADLMVEVLEREQHALRGEAVELRESTRRAAATVRKLLAYGRKADLRRERTDLAGVVGRLHTTIERLAPEPVRIALAAEPGAVADVDPSAVEQILLNLVTNARDAMPGGGTLAIAVRPIVLSPEGSPAEWIKPGAYGLVSVTDSGVGMDERTRARVFEPFFTTKRGGAGTGLGLAMVYGLVKQQEGFVLVESTLGEGTTVRLFFPRSDGVVRS